jgi:hypothetical protein
MLAQFDKVHSGGIEVTLVKSMKYVLLGRPGEEGQAPVAFLVGLHGQNCPSYL